MMRINLLPVREAQKRESLQRNFLYGGIILLLSGLVLLWVQYMVKSQITQLNNEIAALEAQKKKIEQKVGEVKNIDNKKKEVEGKLAIIDKLEKNRLAPVRFLEELANAIPKKVWLENLSTSSSFINLSGTAVTNENISEFMENLERSAYFSKVKLEVTQAAKRSSLKVMKFRISTSYDGTQDQKV